MGVAGVLRSTRSGGALVGVLVVLCGLIWVPAGTAQQAPEPDPPPNRIAFSGTSHRSLGVTGQGQAGSPSLLAETPEHFAQDPSTRGGLTVFTSLRDEANPQVYLRDTSGEVRRLTTGRDAAHPKLSPDLRWVVFDSAEPAGGENAQRELWRVRVDGSQQTRITTTSSNENWPSYSPDGQRIAFAGNASGRWQIYTMPITGGFAEQRTQEPQGAALQPAWNPVDEGRIAYTYDEDGDITNDADQCIRVLLDANATTGPRLLGGDQATWWNRWATWEDDGTGMLFLSRNRLGGGSSEHSLVYRVDASNVPAATPVLLLDENRLVDSPASLPGGRVVVARTTASAPNVATLQDIRPDGGDPRSLGPAVLTEDPAAVTDSSKLFEPGQAFDPWTQRQSYSPDGTRLAVSRFAGPPGAREQRIWLMNADGSDQRELPIADRADGDWETDAAWSPDGERLAVARRSPGGLPTDPDRGKSRIVIVDADSGAVTGRVQPRNQAEDDTQPAFSPDGETLAFSRGQLIVEDSQRYNHIWFADADNLDSQRNVTEQICDCPELVIDDSAAFSPDGRSMAFNREPHGLYRYSLADESCSVILPRDENACIDKPGRPGEGEAPPEHFQPRDLSWSPDGASAVFSERTGQNASEHSSIVDMQSGEVTPLTQGLPGRQKESTWQATVDLSVTAPERTAERDVGDPVQVTATITNNGPAASPGSVAELTVPDGARLTGIDSTVGECRVADGRCDLGLLQPDQTVRVTATVVGVNGGDKRLRWEAHGRMSDSRPADNTATTIFPVQAPEPPPPPPPPPPPAGPGVTVRADPNPSYVGGRTDVTFTVRNTGGSAATGLALDIALPPGIPVTALPPGCTATQCLLPDLPPGAERPVVLVLAPNAALESTITGTLRTTGTDTAPADNLAVTPYRVLQPRIVAVPEVGEPGFVTSVRGFDFPPGVPVRLNWTPGITAAAAPTFPRADGGFAAQLLILPKDQTGPRIITATGPGFSPVDAPRPFLVIVPTVPPPLMGRR